LNILLIDNSVALTGAFKCALNEAELLSHQHHFVFIIPKKSNINSYLEEKGIKYYRLNMLEIHKSLSIFLYPIILLVNTLRVSSIIKKEKIDVVQCNDFYNLLGAGVKLLGYKGIALTYVRFMPSAIPGLLRRLWINVAQKHSHRVIAVSDSVLKQLPLKANTIRLYDAANLVEKINRKKESSSEAIELLYLSNYIQGKGHEYALEAFIRAYAVNNSLRLKFTGGYMGLTKNKEFKTSLEQKTKEHLLTNVVTFTDFNDNIESVIKSADILLNFSNSESLSMTCLESSYFGTPVIATRCGGPEEVIKHNETGILVPIADIDAMTNAIIELSANKTKRTTFAEAGKIYVRDKFSKEKFIQQFNGMLKQ